MNAQLDIGFQIYTFPLTVIWLATSPTALPLFSFMRAHQGKCSASMSYITILCLAVLRSVPVSFSNSDSDVDSQPTQDREPSGFLTSLLFRSNPHRKHFLLVDTSLLWVLKRERSVLVESVWLLARPHCVRSFQVTTTDSP